MIYDREQASKMDEHASKMDKDTMGDGDEFGYQSNQSSQTHGSCDDQTDAPVVPEEGHASGQLPIAMDEPLKFDYQDDGIRRTTQKGAGLIETRDEDGKEDTEIDKGGVYSDTNSVSKEQEKTLEDQDETIQLEFETLDGDTSRCDYAVWSPDGRQFATVTTTTFDNRNCQQQSAAKTMRTSVRNASLMAKTKTKSSNSSPQQKRVILRVIDTNTVVVSRYPWKWRKSTVWLWGLFVCVFAVQLDRY